jgi:hypothetical protein
VWRGANRSERAHAAFFATLEAALAEVLGARGFRLRSQQHLPRSLGHRSAVFEGPAFYLIAAYDGKAADIRLLRRPLQRIAGPDVVLAQAYLGHVPRASAYDRAMEAMIGAAQSVAGAA